MEKNKRTVMINRAMLHRRTQIISFSLIAAAMLVMYFSVSAALTPKRYDVAVGADAPETIYATRNIVDSTLTETLKERARQSTAVVYRIDDETVNELSDGAKTFFDTLGKIRISADKLNISGDNETLSASEWSELLSDEQVLSLAALAVPALDREGICAVLSSTASQLQLFEDIVLPKLTTALSGGLSESGIESVKSMCIREVNATTGLSAALKKVAGKVFDEYMAPTYIADEAATLAAREAAAEAVEDVVVSKGDKIVAKGDGITAAKYAMLIELELVRTADSDIRLEMGLLLYMLTVFSLFAVFVMTMCKKQFYNQKDMIITSSLIALTALLALLCNSLETMMTPTLIGIMLCALLISDRMAVAVCALIALTVGLMSGGRGTTMLEFNSFMMSIVILCGGCTAIISLKRVQSRGAIIAAGAMGGGVSSLVVIAFDVIKKVEIMGIFTNVVWVFASSLVSTLLVAGSLSIFENLFDVATPARLNELTNTNHPLLKKLMMEAPGTYQHSMMVAALAEGAAQSIGADALLARVGGYFHDVGKLKRPLYFKENQKPNENIHDTLLPQESAATIISHQKDSVILLNKYKLPSAVVKIASEHHGNSLMVYFYHKALQNDDEKNVNIKTYKYNGNKPSSRESAIVMLADSCEAAVRSLGDTDKSKVEDMVHKVIWGKITGSDNLLSNAPLTFAELSDIEKSFLKTFNGLMHDRIEYPDLEEKKK